jgi:hypothetical protein
VFANPFRRAHPQLLSATNEPRAALAYGLQALVVEYLDPNSPYGLKMLWDEYFE